MVALEGRDALKFTDVTAGWEVKDAEGAPKEVWSMERLLEDVIWITFFFFSENTFVMTEINKYAKYAWIFHV